MEKLDVMIHLANIKNIDKVLSELKEYATEVSYTHHRNPSIMLL
jgi:hypothetical protein